MKLRMHENSLFAVLLRSPWWISIAIAAGLGLAARLVIPDLYALFVGLPFLVIGASPGGSSSARRAPARRRTLERFGRCSGGISRRDRGRLPARRLRGEPAERRGADFEMTKAGRVSLVSCKRWKVARTGIEPLRELDAERRAREAHECVYVAAGEVTDNARAFAVQKNIRLAQGAALARLLRGSV
jgi:restriction system protein